MSIPGKVVKAEVLLHLAKLAAAGLGLVAAVKGLRAAFGDDDKPRTPRTARKDH